MSFLKRHLVDNGIGSHEARIHECAVSDESGTIDFYVGAPNDFNADTPRTWYGQSISKGYERAEKSLPSTQSDYHGHPVITYESGWKAVTVEKTDIREILRTYGEIDLLDLDVQGEELKIIIAGAEILDRQVKRVHIGTHGASLENGLRNLLHRRGWILIRDYPGSRSNPTPFGDVTFGDGVQSWINPRFAPSVA